MRSTDEPFRSSKTRFSAVAEGVLSVRPPETLQDKMVAEDGELHQRLNASRADILSKLPPLPHELELQGELQDEGELFKLYAEVEAKKREAAEKRHAIAAKKLAKIEQEKKEKMERLQ